MADTKERNAVIAQFLAVSVIAVLAIVGWDLSHRVLAMRDLLQQDSATQVKLTNAMQVNEQLKAMQKLIQSDGWIEQYVRVKWHWEREGETMFIPISPSALPQPLAPPAPPPPPPAKPVWQQWLDSLINTILGPPS